MGPGRDQTREPWICSPTRICCQTPLPTALRGPVIDKVVNKVNRISGLIRRKFTHIDKSTFLTLYKSLVRSNLDYGNLIYYPTTKKCKQILENAQRRATRLVPELRGMSYREGLIELNLSTLD